MDCDNDQIWTHLEFLAAEPRPAESQRLNDCRTYCEQQLRAAGWDVSRRPFSAMSSDGNERSGTNLVATATQKGDSRPTFVLGAHLDSCEHTPGADDNASAVAVLLEIARLVTGQFQADELGLGPVQMELVVFDLEEHGMLGGAFHAAECRQNSETICGMVSLEMLGYCNHEPGSQTVPAPLAGMYPDVADFIAIVGNQNSERLIDHFQNAFGRVTGLKHESLSVPDNGHPLPPSRLSDHSPFWDAGFPALMITDTSFMRNPHYHQPSDTPETLDRDFLLGVANGVWKAVDHMLRDGIA